MPHWEPEFCFFFTIKAGVVICTFQGLTLLSMTALGNLFMENYETDFIYKFFGNLQLFVFMLIMGLGYLSALWSAYSYDITFARAGAALLSIGTLLFLMLSFLSYLPVNSIRRIVCISSRCPDHHWLQRAGWRYGLSKDEDETVGNAPLYMSVSIILNLAIIAMHVYTVYTFFGYTIHLKYNSSDPRIR